jgi:hypothetical protein
MENIESKTVVVDFINNLYTNVFNSSDYTVSNDGKISE